MRLRLFKPLFNLFHLSESRISLNSCWVEVLNNREHLGKVVLSVKGGAFNTHLNVKLYRPCLDPNRI